MSNIFISYRREQTSGYAGRLHDSLSEHFHRNQIFMDIDTVEPGVDFVEAIDHAIDRCEVVIVVIGKGWANITDASGRRRLEQPMDLVRVEVETSLNRNKRVIPVLVGGATMPSIKELPDSLAHL